MFFFSIESFSSFIPQQQQQQQQQQHQLKEKKVTQKLLLLLLFPKRCVFYPERKFLNFLHSVSENITCSSQLVIFSEVVYHLEKGRKF
jgi:hypothetical protein